MSNFNKVIIVGRLSSDPILSYTPAGTPVTKFSLAINSSYKNKAGEKKEDVDFVPVTVWAKQAENAAEWLSKGKVALVDGRIKQERWTNKEGQKRSTLSVTANVVKYLSPSSSTKANLSDNAPAQDDRSPDENNEHCSCSEQ